MQHLMLQLHPSNISGAHRKILQMSPVQNNTFVYNIIKFEGSDYVGNYLNAVVF